MQHPKQDWLQYQINSIKKKISDINSNNLDKAVPRRLDEFALTKCKPSEQFVFVDNNGKDAKLSIKDINSRVLRTVDSIPDDMEEGEYIFLKLDNKR